MKEFRIAAIETEERSEGLAKPERMLIGKPIVFDKITEITDKNGSYKEVISRGALDGCDLSDVKLFYGHDVTKVPLAKTPKTMALEVTPAGLQMRASLADTESAKEVYEAVKRGDLNGMSFAFKVEPGCDSYDARTNTRTINKISKVLEVSVVPFPAYSQTSVEARSAMDTSIERFNKIKAAKILINQIVKVEF